MVSIALKKAVTFSHQVQIHDYWEFRLIKLDCGKRIMFLLYIHVVSIKEMEILANQF